MNRIDDHQGRLSIGQVATATGVSRSTLRHWEREFRDFLETARNEGGARSFAPEAAEKIDQIRFLVEEQGLTLRGVRLQLERLVPKPRDGPSPPPEEDPLQNKARSLADRVTDRLLRGLYEEQERPPPSSAEA